jgi:hypothetical protein
MRTTHIKRTVEVRLTAAEIAAEFLELDHEEQAEVLIAIATTIEGYENSMARHLVPLYIGREMHATGRGEVAAELLRDILSGHAPSPSEDVVF